MLALDSSSDCCLPAVTLPFDALKIAVSSAFSCWPLDTPPWSSPPLFFDCWSIEYFLATDFQDCPESSALLACWARPLDLVSTMRTLRRSAVANCDLCLL